MTAPLRLICRRCEAHFHTLVVRDECPPCLQAAEGLGLQPVGEVSGC